MKELTVDDIFNHCRRQEESIDKPMKFKRSLDELDVDEKGINTKVSNKEVLEIYNSDMLVEDLCKKYNISERHVKRIQRGQTRTDVTGGEDEQG